MVSFYAIMAFYVVIFIIAILTGRFIDKKSQRGAIIGGLVGLSVSIILWFMYGRHMVTTTTY